MKLIENNIKKKMSESKGVINAPPESFNPFKHMISSEEHIKRLGILKICKINWKNNEFNSQFNKFISYYD